MSRPILPWLLGTGVVAVVAWAAFKPAAAGGPEGSGDKAQLVTTLIAQARDVPLRVEAQGTVTALNSVELRPQVSSTIRTIHVREGQDVRAGQVLFTLDTRNDAAKVAQSDADLAQVRAQLKDAERALARAQELRRQNFVSQSAVDSAQSSADALKASLAAREAALGSAKVALSYQTITAPFAGRIGAIDVHPGALVQPGMAAPLTTITQLDPVSVAFTLPERELSRLLASQAQGEAPAQVLPDQGKPIPGKLRFVDNKVDTATGTILVKAEFPNTQRLLWPGAFARVAIELGTEKQAVVLPSGALQTGPQGGFVYVVADDNTVKPQPIKLSRMITEEGKQFGIVSGVKAGNKVVVEGGGNLRPGATVKEAAKDAGKSDK
ncbi:efflux RND transporter periplasmic adaptor subunit [Chitinimonas sp. BJYL2]|uniref:efflux RND transporter periplasmic adaptor subunit n=1 Tax=Chitinimonas sp. BJYL2 TaxID=2976696 RepID=UPI0022B4DD58|nr:efflux RND transporter periplasmic adaptor subunit [Chitinimonas sp. BJYL2]